MTAVDNTFYIRNYTDTEGTPRKSASFKVIQKSYCEVEEVLELRFIINGHIDFNKITDVKSTRQREFIRRKLLKAIGYTDPIAYYDQNETAKEILIDKIIESLISGRGLDDPEGKRTTYSPKGTTKIEQYSIWRDDSY